MNVNKNFENLPLFVKGYFDILAQLADDTGEYFGENVFPDDVEKMTPDIIKFYEKYRKILIDTESDVYNAGVGFALSRHGYGDGLNNKIVADIATNKQWRQFSSGSVGEHTETGEIWVFIE